MLRALAASLHTLFHSIQLFAAFSTSVANFGTDATNLGTESGAAEHEIQRRLADFRTIHHQAEVIGLDMFAACFEAMVHGHSQAGAITMVTCIDTGLQILIGFRV